MLIILAIRLGEVTKNTKSGVLLSTAACSNAVGLIDQFSQHAAKRLHSDSKSEDMKYCDALNTIFNVIVILIF